MRQQMDTLERQNRLCGSLDALCDLIAGQDVNSTISLKLVYIIDFIREEAHALHDEDGGLCSQLRDEEEPAARPWTPSVVD